MTDCMSNDCKEQADVRIFWPGKEPSYMCIDCSDRALGVSKAMGFHLHIEPIFLSPTGENDEQT